MKLFCVKRELHLILMLPTAASTLTASENVVSVLVSKSNDGGGSIAELLEITLSCGRLDGVDCYVFIIEFMLHLW
jgi:hypothetical protein